ncbi:MAG: AAA family ATPase [Candidatus Mcinerneyibacterium aminivorans]|uniref:AAA family ATPase n=1 Tax=Candidatus Mcinerneyibacterium aminivorans TaxID=2703815 RepID=A0A5D0MI55_9BACT|nr:MAG: AAA family ATPase [Candidatus Mcinerneyibacterium aminivorans]
MIINKMVLTNFKQYYGKQEIVFNKKNVNSNVVVVIGENGLGKTTLFRALIYVLYGDRYIEQDEGNSNINGSKIYLTNLAKLKEEGKAECKVVLDFNYKSKRYRIERSLNAVKENKEIYEDENDEVKLTIRKDSGNKIIDNEEKISEIINKIIDKRIAHFFLFDGEKIEKLTRVDTEQKEEIQQGIKKILNIDDLNDSLEVLKLIEKKINKSLEKISTGRYKKLLKQHRQLEEKIEDYKEKVKDIKKQKKLAIDEKKNIDKKMSKYEKIKEDILKRKELEKERKNEIKKKESLNNEIKKFLRKANLILSNDILVNIENDIEQKREKGEIPSDIKKEFIEKLLKEMKCICGRDIKKDSEEYKELIKWKNKSTGKSFDSTIIKYDKKIGELKQILESNKSEMRDLLKKHGLITENIEEYDSQIEKINETIEGKTPNFDISKMEETRKKLVQNIEKYKLKIKDLEKEIKEKEKKLSEFKKEIKKAEKEHQIKNDLTQKRDLVLETKKVLHNIKNEFVIEIVDELEEKSNYNFNKLIDDTGKKNFKGLEIKGDYTLEVLDKEERRFLANISAGQRQIVSLSFITALAQLAGNSDRLNIPLFMDTPFSRLSEKHRMNLLNFIPKIAKQWILLATRTEMTKKELKKLKLTQNWNLLYILNSHEKEKTIIQNKEPNIYINEREG